MSVPKCSECEYKHFEKLNGSPNRYCCQNPEAIAYVGYRMISRCDRGSSELKTKTSPKRCPKRKIQKEEAE